jgi:hypothetical protein
MLALINVVQTSGTGRTVQDVQILRLTLHITRMRHPAVCESNSAHIIPNMIGCARLTVQRNVGASRDEMRRRILFSNNSE